MRETLLFLVLNSLEGKNDPCKSDCPTFYPFGRSVWALTPFSVAFIRGEGRPLYNGSNEVGHQHLIELTISQ